MTDHPLTETAAAVLWNAHRSPNALPFHAQGRLYVQSQTAMLRAAFDAGREHERTTPAEEVELLPLLHQAAMTSLSVARGIVLDRKRARRRSDSSLVTPLVLTMLSVVGLLIYFVVRGLLA